MVFNEGTRVKIPATMFYTKMKRKQSGKYMFYVTKMYNFEKMNTGTGVPSMTTDRIFALYVLIPPSALLQAFDNTISPLYNAIYQYKEENQQLLSIRDFLLPMLMNGQVKLRN